MEDPAGYDPVAAGLKDQSLSIRVYARGPKTPFAIVAHGMCSWCLEALGLQGLCLVHLPCAAHGTSVLSGLRSAAELKVQCLVQCLVRQTGNDPVASAMSQRRSAKLSYWRVLPRGFEPRCVGV